MKNPEGISAAEMLNFGIEEDETDRLSIADEKERMFMVQKGKLKVLFIFEINYF